jgi:Ca2+-binding RTX toxin-like protein
MFESLETRRHLDATIDPRGALTVTGTDAADRIEIWRETRDTLRVTVNGVVRDFANVGSVHVHAGGGDDTVLLSRLTPTARVRGGAGDDSLRSGNGQDWLYGGRGHDTLYGQGGDDILIGDAGGDDMTGGKGTDTVNYRGRTEAVYVGVGHLPDDGRPGEGDNVHVGIEIVEGGAGDDHMRNMGDAPVTLSGNGGRDTLLGGAGGADDDLYGGPGRDTLNGVGGVSTFRAQDGERDVLIGGTGLSGLEKDDWDVLESM